MSQKDFLSFLVDETMKLQQSGQDELSSLEHKLSDYNLGFLKGEFVPQTQMLRFTTSFGVLDVPINWSVFKIEDSGSSDQVLSEDNDNDLLLRVLQNSWNEDLEKILVTHSSGFCYIVGLKAGEDFHIHDLLSPQEWLPEAA